MVPAGQRRADPRRARGHRHARHRSSSRAGGHRPIRRPLGASPTRVTSSATTRTITRGCRCCSAAGFAADIADGAEAIADATGVDPAPWFRCPFGAGHDDPRVLEVARGRRATATSTGTSSSRIGSRGAPATRSPRTASRARSPTATARWCCCTPGPAAPATALAAMIAGLADAGAAFVTARRTGGPPVRRPALLAVDGGGSKIDAALLRRDGTVLGARRVAAQRLRAHRRRRVPRADRRGDRGRRAPTRAWSMPAHPSRMSASSASRAPTSRWTTGGSAAASPIGAGSASTSCATTPSPCCGRAPTGTGAWASSAASARTAPASRPTGACTGCRRSARSAATGAAAASSAGPRCGTPSARGTDAGPRTTLQRSIPAHFGMRTARQVMEALYTERLGERSARRARTDRVRRGRRRGRDRHGTRRTPGRRDRDHGNRRDPQAPACATSTPTWCSAAASSAIDWAPVLRAHRRRACTRIAPGARIVRLTAPPVVGAAMLGLDLLGAGPAAHARARAGLTHRRLDPHTRARKER